MNYRHYLLHLWNLWPPFFFSGIKVVKRSKDFRHIVSCLKLRFWSANLVGTQYGGSMFSMTDAFYMVMLMKNLGPDYVIWDKSATIHYLKPGKTDLFAEFLLTDEDLEMIKKAIEEHGKMQWNRLIEIKDLYGNVIAEVEKTISIKKRYH